MKKFCLFVFAFALALSLAACGEKEEPGIPEEQQLIIDALNTKLASEEFAVWQSCYEELTDSAAAFPEVSNITRFQLSDLGGAKMDCYLIRLRADLAYRGSGKEESETVTDSLYIYIDIGTGAVYDSIETESSNIFKHDTSSEQGRVAYLLWIYENIMKGEYSGNFVNDNETATQLSEAVLKTVNEGLKYN